MLAERIADGLINNFNQPGNFPLGRYGVVGATVLGSFLGPLAFVNTTLKIVKLGQDYFGNSFIFEVTALTSMGLILLYPLLREVE